MLRKNLLVTNSGIAYLAFSQASKYFVHFFICIYSHFSLCIHVLVRPTCYLSYVINMEISLPSSIHVCMVRTGIAWAILTTSSIYIEDIMFILRNKNKITFLFHRKAQAATRGCQAMDQLG